jgi:hypothetical protein
MCPVKRCLQTPAIPLPEGSSAARGSFIFKPPTIEHLALRTGHAPPHTQTLEQHRREHGVSVTATLALLDAQCHAFAVDVGDLQRYPFAGA